MPGHQRSKLPTLAETLSVVHAIAQTVTSTKYAICGGGACVVLGSARQTEDVDFVVPRGDTKKARSDLRSSQSFTVQPRTNHTAFVGPNRDVEPIDIEILAPPVLFRYNYIGTDSEVMLVRGARVLSPYIILESKVGAIFSRSTDQKRKTDAADIIFLANFLASNRLQISVGQAGLSEDFIAAFLQQFPNAEEIFKRAQLLPRGRSNTPTNHIGLEQSSCTTWNPTERVGASPEFPSSSLRPTTPAALPDNDDPQNYV